jgi:hypothetical protein
MKHFVPAGSSRTLKCSSEKFIVDFALEIGVTRQPWNTQQSKSFYENLRSQMVTQYQDAQGGSENAFTPHSTAAISWLTAFIACLEPGYLATKRVREKLLQLEQSPVLKGISVFDRHSQLSKLRTQLTFKLEQLENRLQSVNLIEYGREHYEQVFALWDHGHYFPFSPAGRCYIALQELYWGTFGEAILLADDLQKTRLIEEVRVRVIDKLASEVNASSNTRHYYHEWLTTPTSPGVLEYKEALAWLGDASHVEKQPVSYSVTQTWCGISLGMPRICSAMRLGGALVDELLVYRFD